MPGDLLGVGWAFPITPNDNDIALARAEDSVHQSIQIILGTARGERVRRPDFGCGVHDLVFAVNNAATFGQIASEVRQSLIEWEPRIDLLDVQVTSSETPGVLLITVSYLIRSTNNQFNLIYPFFLERSAV